MNKKDILELKRRFKKDDCTFTKMCGCYVDSQKNIVLKIKETFLNIPEEEFFKYLEIAKKTLSGTIGNNLLQLNFPIDEENIGGRQLTLMELKKSALKNEALLDEFYNLVIKSYDYTGNFLILIFHDAYDVMTKTTDNAKLDESEEVYEYLLCAICPVTLSKPGLGYLEDKNKIGARVRDWIVGAPEIGFVFPAFIDRSTDIHSIMYYTKDTKNPHSEFMEEALGCSSKQTATEQKEVFQNIIKKAVSNDDKAFDKFFMEIQDTLNNVKEEHTTVNGKNSDPVILSSDNIQDILVESGIPEEISSKIEKSYIKEFGEEPPAVDNLIDKKTITLNEQRKKEEKLQKRVKLLEQKLEVNNNSPEDIINNSNNIQNDTDGTNLSSPTNDNNNIILKVNPQKVPQIKAEFIDGQKCIIIPIDDNEKANVNGITTLL